MGKVDDLLYHSPYNQIIHWSQPNIHLLSILIASTFSVQYEKVLFFNYIILFTCFDVACCIHHHRPIQGD